MTSHSRSRGPLSLALSGGLLFTSAAMQASWSKAPAGPSARSGACAASDGANCWLFGGYLEDEHMARTVSNDLWRFEDDEWVCVAPAAKNGPRPRLCSTLTKSGDHLVLLGGWDPGSQGDGGDILDDVWSYDINKGEWKKLDATLPGPRSRHAAVALDDGRVVAVTHREVLVFDPATQRVAVQPTSGEAPSSRGLHVAAKLDGSDTLVVFGGAAQDGGMCDDAFLLDCETWTW
eukprot:CAMPEP_0119288184 /NCGR_PEP_ID=MMETSP1329-20130426/36791_1 /TAXON_ID=114041 /ORGANISM="Genus nov. species nov., Strain RCC1024" /LENGTH=232 /DNA_ID=CAMNT_0007288965 /DNA_START=130 /DNA_END=825 /DNA_ORIENTATION=-